MTIRFSDLQQMFKILKKGRLDRYRIRILRELSEIRTQPWLSEESLHIMFYTAIHIYVILLIA